MTSSGSAEITRLLKRWREGDPGALDRLAPKVYAELRRIARRYMRRERPGNTLQTTALVNEAYLRLVGAGAVEWHDRAHFFAVSAQMMRRILVDAARARAAVKRGGEMERVEHATDIDFDRIPDASPARDRDLMAVDDALEALSHFDPRMVRVVELRFFGGLSLEETAAALKLSADTVWRDWDMAKCWLYRTMRHGAK